MSGVSEFFQEGRLAKPYVPTKEGLTTLLRSSIEIVSTPGAPPDLVGSCTRSIFHALDSAQTHDLALPPELVEEARRVYGEHLESAKAYFEQRAPIQKWDLPL